MSQKPGGRGVGAVALVEESDSRFVIGVAEIVVETGELISYHQTLVAHGPTRERGHVDVPQICRGETGLYPLPREEQEPLKSIIIEPLRSAEDELLHEWTPLPGPVPKHLKVDRGITPHQVLKGGRPYLGIDLPDDALPGCRILNKEDPQS